MVRYLSFFAPETVYADFFAVSNRFSPLGKGIAWRELTLEVIETTIYTPATIPAEPTQVKYDSTYLTRGESHILKLCPNASRSVCSSGFTQF